MPKKTLVIKIRVHKQRPAPQYETFEFEGPKDSFENCTNLFTLLEDGMGIKVRNGQKLKVTIATAR